MLVSPLGYLVPGDCYTYSYLVSFWNNIPDKCNLVKERFVLIHGPSRW